MTDAAARPPLRLHTKVSYGLGSVAQSVAGVALSAAIINFYLVRVIGLRPELVGVVLFLSLAIDAVLDPVIGRWSDNFRSRWGRRHPFMYASAVPVGLAIYFLWHPPRGLPDTALAAFMFVMLVVLRLCVSLYQIPSDALTPELAPDYHERTGLISYRYFFGIAGGVVMTVILLDVFIPKDHAHPLGFLNREGYAQFGLLAAIVVFVSIVVSSMSTHRYIPYLSRAPQRRQSVVQSTREIVATLGNPSLIVVMLSGLFSGIAGGLAGSLGNFINVYFWGLTPQVVSLLVVFTAPAYILGVVLAPALSRALDKKRTMITVFFLSIFTGVIPITLRLVGLMPPNGSPWIPAILIVDGFVAGSLALIGFVIISSMIADVVEDSAVKTGVRSEGLLFAANGLLPKFTTGIGGMVGNLMLVAAHFPTGVHKGGPVDFVDPSIMRHLVLLSMPTSVVLNSIAVSVLIFYRIDRSSHERNLETLAQAAAFADAGLEHDPEAGITLGGPAVKPVQPFG
ncbi:MAG: MFS transporter [Caulobacterales bacterium]